jgi:hypothetical protein
MAEAYRQKQGSKAGKRPAHPAPGSFRRYARNLLRHWIGNAQTNGRDDARHQGKAGERRESAQNLGVWALVGMSIAAMGFYGSKGLFWAISSVILTGAAAASGIAWINSVGNLRRWTK